MSAKYLDGKQLSQSVCANLKQQVATLHRAHSALGPGLAVILVGADPASQIYVQKKRNQCLAVGITSFLHHFPVDVNEETVLSCIEKCNCDPAVSGILVQLPLPAHIDTQTIITAISPDKDVDGFHPYNLGRLAQQAPALRPCTPYGIIRLLQSVAIPLKGRHAVVVGASNIVGRPMALELLLEEATVTVCHEATHHLQHHVAQADILIIAVGKQGVVSYDWLKKGVVVVDVGIHRLPGGKIVGDIIGGKDTHKVLEKASWVTPVPGGVGPMTVAMLLYNTVCAYAHNQLPIK